MTAVFYEEYGGVEKMKVGERPKPAPLRPGEVLIETRAAGLNPVDWKIREGLIKAWPQALPIITGWDTSGTIVEVGSEVADYKVGDEVYSYNRPAFESPELGADDEPIGVDGCCAQVVRSATWKIAPKPKTLSFPQAGAVPLAALTAYQGIFDKGGLSGQKTLLVLNSSGGVGSFAVQFAVAKGFKVVGTCSSRNTEYVKSLGAIPVDYTKNAVIADVKKVAGFESGVDVVMDCVGGESTNDGIELLKNTGRIVSIVNFDIASAAKAKNKKGEAFLVACSGKQLKEIGQLIDAGKVKVQALKEFPLASAVEAFTSLQTHRIRGKIVLTI